MKNPARIGLLVAVVLVLAGCIERAPSPRDRREKFGRGGLDNVLMSSVPQPMGRVGAVFGDAAELVGVDVAPQKPKPGDEVTVSFYYRVLDETDDDWKIFVHIDDRGGSAERINGDHWPAGGKYPTGVWRKGEVVKDVWTFKVPGFYNGDALDIWTGFYPPGKDDRWPVTNGAQVRNDGQNRVLAYTILMR